MTACTIQFSTGDTFSLRVKTKLEALIFARFHSKRLGSDWHYVRPFKQA